MLHVTTAVGSCRKVMAWREKEGAPFVMSIRQPFAKKISTQRANVLPCRRTHKTEPRNLDKDTGDSIGHANLNRKEKAPIFLGKRARRQHQISQRRETASERAQLPLLRVRQQCRTSQWAKSLSKGNWKGRK